MESRWEGAATGPAEGPRDLHSTHTSLGPCSDPYRPCSLPCNMVPPRAFDGSISRP